MTRIDSLHLGPRAILLGLSMHLVILLAKDEVPNDRIHARSRHMIESRSSELKAYQISDSSLNQTNVTSEPTDSLLIDPNYGLKPTLSSALVTTALLTAPTDRPTSFSQAGPFQVFSGNMTVSLPTPTLSMPTVTANASEHVSYPTPTSGINPTYNNSVPVAQSNVTSIVTVNASNSTATPVDHSLEPSTSTAFVYATSSPTKSNSSAQGNARTSGVYLPSTPKSLTLLIGIFIIALFSYV
ncbi:hypothetical protein CROQUDRAFT_670876 [Cronartium quercuum f. sp. fusiforme G11]|uniref:Uncharacterized protein n=1 Tax=Cronartium quercuum f. sp. fusiforme G11 TaxID=708437 RepID=A0A9P6NNP2_9BASI|nr:hypothetical protein CROQUDRAFT_670876 [Cronartium quercuum f. sp. fusiforme G11]